MDPIAFLSTQVSVQIILHHLQKFETEEQGTERENQNEVIQTKDCLQRYIQQSNNSRLNQTDGCTELQNLLACFGLG